MLKSKGSGGVLSSRRAHASASSVTGPPEGTTIRYPPTPLRTPIHQPVLPAYDARVELFLRSLPHVLVLSVYAAAVRTYCNTYKNAPDSCRTCQSNKRYHDICLLEWSKLPEDVATYRGEAHLEIDRFPRELDTLFPRIHMDSVN